MPQNTKEIRRISHEEEENLIHNIPFEECLLTNQPLAVNFSDSQRSSTEKTKELTIPLKTSS